MTLYRGDPSTLKAVHGGSAGPDVWYIHDAFGEYDGPYASQSDCNAVVLLQQKEWETAGRRNAQ